MNAFFGNSNKPILTKISVFSSYPLMVFILYFFVNIPLVNMLGNLISVFLITFLYESGMLKRVLFCFFLYLFMFAIEASTALLTGYIGHSPIQNGEYSDPLGPIIVALLLYLFSLIFMKRIKARNNDLVELEEWIAIFLIPLASIFLTIVISVTNNLKAIQGVISVFLIFMINILVFYIYERLLKSYNNAIEMVALEQEKKYYYEQCSYMEKSSEELRSFRHDISNHLISLTELISEGKMEQAQMYISSIFEKEIGESILYSETGNVAIDSVLNYKLTQAKENKIKILADISVPNNLLLDPTDITAITGNMLDNAINALKKIEIEKRKLFVNIYYDRGRLFVIIKNTFNGEVTEKNGQLQTNSVNKVKHGYGIKNIKKHLQKYNGIIDYVYDATIFSAAVMMYVNVC